MKKGTLGKSWNYIKTRTIVLFFPRTSLLCERDSNTWPFHMRGYVYRIEGPTTYFHPYRLWFVRLWVHHSLFVRLDAHIHGVYVLINKKKSQRPPHMYRAGRWDIFFFFLVQPTHVYRSWRYCCMVLRIPWGMVCATSFSIYIMGAERESCSWNMYIPFWYFFRISLKGWKGHRLPSGVLMKT